MSPSSSSQKPKNAALMSSKSTSDCHHHWKRKLYPGEEKSVLTDRAEQLFAVGYAACFHSGLLSVAQGSEARCFRLDGHRPCGDRFHRSRRIWLGGRPRPTRAPPSMQPSVPAKR
jgi:hypothetical protein